MVGGKRILLCTWSALTRCFKIRSLINYEKNVMRIVLLIPLTVLVASCATKHVQTKEWVRDGQVVTGADLSKIENECDMDEKHRKAYKMIAGKGGVYNAQKAGDLINEVKRCMEGKGLVLRGIKT